MIYFMQADDSHETSGLIFLFLKKGKILNCRLLHIVGGPLWAKTAAHVLPFQWTSFFLNVFKSKILNLYFAHVYLGLLFVLE